MATKLMTLTAMVDAAAATGSHRGASRLYKGLSRKIV